jgi:hypothetical protein
MITNNTLNPAWKTILRVRANEFAIPAKLLMRVLLEIEASRGILRAELIRRIKSGLSKRWYERQYDTDNTGNIQGYPNFKPKRRSNGSPRYGLARRSVLCRRGKGEVSNLGGGAELRAAAHGLRRPTEKEGGPVQELGAIQSGGPGPELGNRITNVSEEIREEICQSLAKATPVTTG